MEAITTIQDLAESTRQQFERKTRTNGDVFWSIKDYIIGSWLQELCHDAHRYGSGPDQDMLPDDVRYAFIVDALDALAEHESTDDARDSLEPSIYNHELWTWLGSHGLRYSYIDTVCERGGRTLEESGIFLAYGQPSRFEHAIAVTDSNSFVELVQRAQLAEKLEVFDSVLSSLMTRLHEQGGE